MRKRHVAVNLLFSVVWLLYFLAYNSNDVFFVTTYIFNCWFVLPIVAAVYNFIAAKKGSQFILLSGVFLVSQVAAYLCSNGYLLTEDMLFLFNKEYTPLLEPILINSLIFFWYTAFFFFIVWIVFINKKEEKVEICNESGEP